MAIEPMPETIRNVFKAHLGDPQATKALRYLSSLTPAARELVTEHKLGLAIDELDFQRCRRALKACADQGLARKRYAICCPFCGTMLFRQDSQELLAPISDEEDVYCHYCDRAYPRNVLMQQDVRTLFDFSEEDV